MAKPKPKKSGVHINLMVTDELHRKVQARADHHHFTVNNMVRVMILEYLEGLETQSLERIRKDMEICWARFSNRYTRLGLEEEIIDALATAQNLDDLARLRGLARASQSLREVGEQRERRLLAERALTAGPVS